MSFSHYVCITTTTLLVALCFLSVGSHGSDYPDTTSWTNVLQACTNTSGELSGIHLTTVNYTCVNASSDFQEFLDDISTTNTTGYNKTEFYSFWINAYNAMAVKTVARNPCDHDPIGHCGGCISSILDVGDWYLKPIWGFTAGQVAGKSYSLDDIEGMLRDPPANMGNFTEDSRLHAAIVCASISCPNLRNEAFSPSDNVYNFQMTDQMQSFLSNNKKGMDLDMGGDSVELSSIFNWFAPDFQNYAGANGSVIGFVSQFVTNQTEQDYLNNNTDSISVSYFDYDWDVNASDMPCDDCASRPCYPIWAMLLTGGVIILLALILTVACCCVCWRRRRAAARYTKYEEIESLPHGH
eukprot:TRINITY_DN3744_c0_g1_i1.p1 TRINITY_DN3744_c0_g1~~TRINITY_DN3744_c0_g1_i1.p1  ORF type:complete len:353 (+),score=53.87 TRINITY_DN3744_c0_g1_i1:153-1211(+)